MEGKLQRLNISFPRKVADELSSLIPPGKRSKLVVDATKKELQKLKLLKVLERTAGVWTDINHPDLRRIEDVRTWVRKLRQSDGSRSSRLRVKK